VIVVLAVSFDSGLQIKTEEKKWILKRFSLDTLASDETLF
jgi:hypothetical protein